MKRTGAPNNGAARSESRTTSSERQKTSDAIHDDNSANRGDSAPVGSSSKRQPKQPKQPKLYCPTDETDLIGDQQQVSLLDSRELNTQERVKSGAKTTFTFAASMMIGANKNDQLRQQQQQHQAKKAAAPKKENILAGDGQDEDIEANSKTRARTGRLKWILITLMGLLLVLFLVVIALLSFTTLLSPEDEDLCLDRNQPFQPSSYRLFSTKTLYTTALNYLSLVPLTEASLSPVITLAPTAASLVSISPGAANANPNVNSNANLHTTSTNQAYNNYDRSSIYRPKFFSPNQTLESIHKKLTALNCQARQLHFYGRHAARLPSQDGLTRLASALESIKKRIDLTISQSAAAADSQRQPVITTASTTTNTASGASSSSSSSTPLRQQTSDGAPAANGSRNACSDPLVQFSEWKMFADPKQGNLVTEMGALETSQMAARFKRLYPELFDNMTSEISIGTTSAIRTAQTAVNFLKHVDNLDYVALGICNLADFPSEDQANRDQAGTINNHHCYKSLIAAHKKPDLSFHDRCASVDDNKRIELDPSNFTGWISKSVSKRLKLTREQDQLNHMETKALHDLCKYETSLTGLGSIWCSLFTEQQMKIFEYMADVDDFNSAYGSPLQAQSACALTKDLFEHYLGIRTQKKPPRNKAQFYFTHSKVIQKLIAASINLSRDPAYYPSSKILDYLKASIVPKEREWQTSLLTPFSANIAFTLYDCPAEMRPEQMGREEATTTMPLFVKSTINLGGAPSQLKVVASLNEQPIKLDGCDDYACDLDVLYIHSRLARDKHCNLDEICGPPS